MPIIHHKDVDHTGQSCWVFDSGMWQQATVIRPDRIAYTPFFGLSGHAELPITSVRLKDGREVEVGCMALTWLEPEWPGIRKEVAA